MDSAIEVREVFPGHIAESVTFLDDYVELGAGNETSIPMRSVGYVSGKRKTTGVERESGIGLPLKVLAFEIGDGCDNETAALLAGIGREIGWKSCSRSDHPDKTLIELGLSELEVMATAKAGEMGLGFNVDSNDGEIPVPTIGSSGILPDVDAVRTKHYRSQSAKSLLKDFFEHSPPVSLDAVHQTTSFSADQMIPFAKDVGLEVSLSSFVMLDDILLQINLIGRGGGGGKASAGHRSLVVPKRVLERMRLPARFFR